MPKRICMVAYTHYRTDARPRREAEALAARGDKVDFLALHEPEAPEREIIGGVQIIRLPEERYRGSRTRLYLASYTRFFLRAMAAVTWRHLSKRYDVVHIHTMPDLMVFASGLVKAFGTKVILDVHDTMPELYQSKFALGEQHPLIRLLGLQESLSCRFADRVICVHEPHRKLVVSRGVDPNKVSVVLNVPDANVFGPVVGFEPPAQNGPARLVYHGTVATRLGVDIAVEAFARVRDRLPESRFDIYGTGDDDGRIRALIDSLGLQDQVAFAGRQFQVDAIPRLLAGATLGVVSNRDDPATRYMLPVKLLEYAHLGIPIVAPRLPTIAHHFDEASVTYFEPGNVASLAEAIVGLLGDPMRQQAQASNAALFARSNGWETMKNRLYEVVDG